MIIATLIKLLDIKIVANKLFGFESSSLTLWLAFELILRFSLSLGLREKKATSDPEIKAENNRRKNNTTSDIIAPNEIGLKKPVNKIEVK